MKQNIAKIASSYLVAFLALGVAGPGSAATNQDFDSAGDPFATRQTTTTGSVGAVAPTVLGPDAFSDFQYMQLLSGGLFGRSFNNMAFDLTDPGLFNRVVADFDFRITCSGARTGFNGGGCADGFAFVLLDTATFGTTGAAPAVLDNLGRYLNFPTFSPFALPSGAFTVAFNTFDNGGCETTNTVELTFQNGLFVCSDPVPFDLATGTFGAAGQFHHAHIDLTIGGPSPKITVVLTRADSTTVTPFNDFNLSAVANLAPFESRVAFAAFCGDACATYDLDNINVQYLDLVGGPKFQKEIISGNDIDAQDGIDLAVEVGLEDPSMYDFKINYNQPDLPPVQIEDTVPAEWNVVLTDDSLGCDIAQANKGKKANKSATKIVCQPETTEGMVTVWATARCHGNRRNTKCRPTSCGALYLNNGAAAYELDPDTDEPVVDPVTGERLPPLLETNNLCLVAVEDLDGGGIDYTGGGDEDGDGLLDHNEACDIGTNPCLEDTDGDGVSDFDEVASGCMDPLNPDTDGDTINDGDELDNGTDPCDEDTDADGVRDDVDSCPLEGPPNESLGEILDSDGCLRQSQCSDGIDNDDDGPIDFAGGDLSCDDILDDSEDTTDPALADCSNGAVKLSTAPGGLAVVCDDPTNNTCEQNAATLCPVGWNLCGVNQHNNRNDGWNYPVAIGGSVVVGEIYCRTASTGAGHFTLGPYNGVNNLGQDTILNCGFGSSRDTCPAGFGCNETYVQALCCAPDPLCGNGAVDGVEEECDDGNSDETDACLNNCTFRVPGAIGIAC